MSTPKSIPNRVNSPSTAPLSPDHLSGGVPPPRPYSPHELARLAEIDAKARPHNYYMFVPPPPKPLGPLNNYQDPPTAPATSHLLPSQRLSASSVPGSTICKPPATLDPAVVRNIEADLNAQAQLECRALDYRSAYRRTLIEEEHFPPIPDHQPRYTATPREELTSHANRATRMRLARAIVYSANELIARDGLSRDVLRLMHEANRLVTRAPIPPEQRKMAVKRIASYLSLFNANPLAFPADELKSPIDRFAVHRQQIEAEEAHPPLTIFDIRPTESPLQLPHPIVAAAAATAARAEETPEAVAPPARAAHDFLPATSTQNTPLTSPSALSSLHASSFTLPASNLSGSPSLPPPSAFTPESQPGRPMRSPSMNP